MATISQLIDRTANDLGLLRLGQTLQAQDEARIESAYNEVYEALKKDGLVEWASTADIPTRFVPYIVSLVVDNCINTYGVSDSRYKRLKNEIPNAKREIMKLTSPDYTSMENATDY